MVRAHAMRNVRRNQRLELMAQYQKRLITKAPKSEHADSSVTAEHSLQMNPNGWFTGDKADADGPVAPHEMLSKLGFINMGHLASRNEAEPAAECDEQAQRSDYWQSYGEEETRALMRPMPGTCRTGSPKSLVGDGVFDPFNAMPIASCNNYNGYILNHFASVIALSCLPVDQGKDQNPLTKIWLPYALQDSTLLLTTLTFAQAHLEILSGDCKSQRILLRKGDSIKAVNAKLGDREHALSNETIGSVAMLAAMESILGNYKEFQIHINGLQRMVYMRGGLQSLGWDGVLHMFIAWQDLLSSAMMASALPYEQTPCCLLIRGSLPYSNPIFPECGLSTELCGEIAAAFQNMRYLSRKINNWDTTQTTRDIMSFSKMRTNMVDKLLSFANRKPAAEMTNLDYHIETCRLAALIYIKFALHMYFPLCAIIRSLKAQLMNIIKQGEANHTIGLGARPPPGSITWTLFICGSLSLDKDEEEWFAVRIARGIRPSGVETWAEMEEHLGRICWLPKLNTPTCRSLWRRVGSLHAEYWAAQVRVVASDCNRSGLYYWYPRSEEEFSRRQGSSNETMSGQRECIG